MCNVLMLGQRVRFQFVSLFYFSSGFLLFRPELEKASLLVMDLGDAIYSYAKLHEFFFSSFWLVENILFICRTPKEIRNVEFLIG